MAKKLKSKNHYSMKKKDINKGIFRCLSNVKELLEESQRLTRKESDNSVALGLYSFAIEEFGKALMLKDYLVEDRDEYQVSKYEIFTTKKSHDLKFEKALKDLPLECIYAVPGFNVSTTNTAKEIVLTPRGDSVTLGPAVTGTVSMIASFPTDFDMRMHCFYVDWDDLRKDWKFKPRILATSIDDGIQKFKLHLHEFEKSFLNDTQK